MYKDYTGIITGIQQTTRSGGGPALKFFFNAVTRKCKWCTVVNVDANLLKPGYPILVTGTKVGNGLTSIKWCKCISCWYWNYFC